MKIWVDDVRPAPKDYIWCKSVEETKQCIENAICSANVTIADINATDSNDTVELEMLGKRLKYYEDILIDLDHDAGEFAWAGGDYIKILDWLEETKRKCTIRIHSMNTVGVENMRRIIQRNGWKEIK